MKLFYLPQFSEKIIFINIYKNVTSFSTSEINYLFYLIIKLK